jgi:hypothetical protein
MMGASGLASTAAAAAVAEVVAAACSNSSNDIAVAIDSTLAATYNYRCAHGALYFNARMHVLQFRKL